MMEAPEKPMQPDLPPLVSWHDALRQRRVAQPEGAREAPQRRRSAPPALPVLDGNYGLWYKYKHFLPVPITVVAGLILTAIMSPYFLDPLIKNLALEHFDPHYVGVKGLDTFLGFVVPFFTTMANSENYGIIPLGYFVTTHLAWHMVGAIESVRSDAKRSIFVRYYTLVVVAALVIGSYVITPLFWIVPYLSFNKAPVDALMYKKPDPPAEDISGHAADEDAARVLSNIKPAPPPEYVEDKRILRWHPAACFVAVFLGFFFALGGMMLSHSPAKFKYNTALFFTTPLLWQPFWSLTWLWVPLLRRVGIYEFAATPARARANKADEDEDDEEDRAAARRAARGRVGGHRAAMNALFLIAGAALLWHMYAIIAVVRDPTVATNLLRVFTHYDGHLHTILFITVDEIVLWAGFLMIPWAQEGVKAALSFVLMTIIAGPGAALAFYFFWRESNYLDVAEYPDLTAAQRKKMLRASLSSIVKRVSSLDRHRTGEYPRFGEDS